MVASVGVRSGCWSVGRRVLRLGEGRLESVREERIVLICCLKKKSRLLLGGFFVYMRVNESFTPPCVNNIVVDNQDFTSVNTFTVVNNAAERQIGCEIFNTLANQKLIVFP